MRKSDKIRQQIAALEAAAREAEQREREAARRRVARAAERAGLAGLDLPGDVLERELRALRERLDAGESDTCDADLEPAQDDESAEDADGGRGLTGWLGGSR